MTSIFLDAAGLWLERRDKAGNVLYQQVLQDPLLPVVEVVSETGGFAALKTGENVSARSTACSCSPSRIVPPSTI